MGIAGELGKTAHYRFFLSRRGGLRALVAFHALDFDLKNKCSVRGNRGWASTFSVRKFRRYNDDTLAIFFHT